MLNVLRVPAILLCALAIIAGITKGGFYVLLMMPAAAGAWVLIVTDKNGRSIDDFFAFLFGLTVVVGVIAVVVTAIKALI